MTSDNKDKSAKPNRDSRPPRIETINESIQRDKSQSESLKKQTYKDKD